MFALCEHWDLRMMLPTHCDYFLAFQCRPSPSKHLTVFLGLLLASVGILGSGPEEDEANMTKKEFRDQHAFIQVPDHVLKLKACSWRERASQPN